MTILLGNDVVDLASPHAKGKSSQPRFVKKILTDLEQIALSDFPDPDTALWMYWAAKESAYKALSRPFPDVSSSPKKYQIRWRPPFDKHKVFGNVQTPKGTLPVTCLIDLERVSCLCYQLPFFTVLRHGHAELPFDTHLDYTRTTEEQSHLARESAIGSLSAFLNCPSQSITIRKPVSDQGLSTPPGVWINGEQTDILLSLSHDGRFVSYAWGVAC